MRDSRLQTVINHLDDADQLIAELTSERTSTSRPEDFQNLHVAALSITQAISSVLGADDNNRVGITGRSIISLREV